MLLTIQQYATPKLCYLMFNLYKNECFFQLPSIFKTDKPILCRTPTFTMTHNTYSQLNVVQSNLRYLCVRRIIQYPKGCVSLAII